MQFNTTQLMLFSMFVTGLVASPIANQEQGSAFVEHYREVGKNGGTLIYYGPANSTEIGDSNISNTQSLQERASCGTSSTTPTCSTDHAARNDVCTTLVNELYDDADVKVQESPRQICYLGGSASNEYCCVSWDKPVKTLTKGDLAPFASKSESIFLALICVINAISY
jgi:hypothetical protein